MIALSGRMTLLAMAMVVAGLVGYVLARGPLGLVTSHLIGAAFAAFVLLLLPTTLLGATLPALSRTVVEDPSQVGPRVGMLYVGVLEAKYDDLGRRALSLFVLITLAGMALLFAWGWYRWRRQQRAGS